MTLIAILVAISLLVVWLVVLRPRWLAVVGRALFDAMAVAGRWYTLCEPAVACRPAEDPKVEAARLNDSGAYDRGIFDATSLDAAGRREAELTARRLTGLLTRDDYQQAMAALAAADATRHPLPIPPGPDG
jgi:hypothetical protein